MGAKRGREQAGQTVLKIAIQIDSLLRKPVLVPLISTPRLAAMLPILDRKRELRRRRWPKRAPAPSLPATATAAAAAVAAFRCPTRLHLASRLIH